MKDHKVVMDDTDTKKKPIYLLKEYATFDYDPEEVKPSLEDPKKPMILKGILQRCNTLNQNGRIYPRDILLRELKNYDKLVKENRAWGCLDHLDSAIVELKHACHLVKEIWMDGDTVMGKIQILDTPCGEIVKALIRAGGKPGISSRALGSLEESAQGKIVQDDLQLVCFDLVSEPSTNNSFMSLSEARVIDYKLYKSSLLKSDKINRALNEILLSHPKK